MSSTWEKIIDAHVHVASLRFIPRAFMETSLENLLVGLRANGARIDMKRLMDMGMPKFQDHQADQLVAAMDRAGVAQTVLLLPDFTIALKEPGLTIEEMIVEHHQILLRHPDRFFLFAGVDPRWGEDGLRLFEHAIKNYQVRGFKIYPPCGYSPSDSMLYPFYDLCRYYQIPVLLHTGPSAPVLSFNQAHPSLIDQAARDFPDVNFILAHGGVNHVPDAVNMVAFRPNVYLDISAYAGVLDPRGVTEHLIDLFNLGINHKIIFGTDCPLFNMRTGYEELFTYVTGEEGALQEVSETEADLILYKNIERLLANAGHQKGQEKEGLA